MPLDGPLGDAIDGLSRDQRIALLATLAEAQVAIDADDLSTRIVAGDPEVFRALLGAKDSSDGSHLAPLANPTRPAWAALAAEALRAGCAADDVARASLGVAGRLGDADRLLGCREAFEKLLDAADDGMVEVGRAGVRVIDRLLTEATERARRDAMRGL